MATIDVKDATGVTVALEKPLTPGRAAAASSRPVVLSTEDKTALDAVATQTTLAAINAKLVTGTVIGDVNLGAVDNAVLDAIAASVAAIDTDTSTIIDHVDGLEALIGTTN